MAGRPRKQYDKVQAATVQALSQYGVPQETIAEIIEMHVQTMQKLYGEEIKKGRASADAKLLETVFKRAINGNDTLLIFLCKTRLGMSEKQHVDLNSSVKVVLFGEEK